MIYTLLIILDSIRILFFNCNDNVPYCEYSRGLSTVQTLYYLLIYLIKIAGWVLGNK